MFAASRSSNVFEPECNASWLNMSMSYIRTAYSIHRTCNSGISAPWSAQLIITPFVSTTVWGDEMRIICPFWGCQLCLRICSFLEFIPPPRWRVEQSLQYCLKSTSIPTTQMMNKGNPQIIPEICVLGFTNAWRQTVTACWQPLCSIAGIPSGGSGGGIELPCTYWATWCLNISTMKQATLWENCDTSSMGWVMKVRGKRYRINLLRTF